jgi:glutaredoxin
VKEFLSRAGQPFTVKLVDEDTAAYDELIALGYRMVPVTVINGQAVRGFDPTALAKALAAAG